MSDEYKVVCDSYVLGPDGRRAEFAESSNAEWVCAKLNSGDTESSWYVWLDWPDRYRVQGCCVVDYNGRLARFASKSGAKFACDKLNSGERKAGDYSWESAVEPVDSAEPICDCPDECAAPDTGIIRESVFRDQDWGLGMFDDDDVRVVVSDGRIFPMVGTRMMDFTCDGLGLAASEARAIAMMLEAAAKEVEGETSAAD